MLDLVVGLLDEGLCFRHGERLLDYCCSLYYRRKEVMAVLQVTTDQRSPLSFVLSPPKTDGGVVVVRVGGLEK